MLSLSERIPFPQQPWAKDCLATWIRFVVHMLTRSLYSQSVGHAPPLPPKYICSLTLSITPSLTHSLAETQMAQESHPSLCLWETATQALQAATQCWTTPTAPPTQRSSAPTHRGWLCLATARDALLSSKAILDPWCCVKSWCMVRACWLSTCMLTSCYSSCSAETPLKNWTAQVPCHTQLYRAILSYAHAHSLTHILTLLLSRVQPRQCRHHRVSRA